MHPSMESYLELLGGQNKSDGTVEHYRSGLQLFSEWVANRDEDPRDLSPRDIKRFLAWLNNAHDFAPKTVRSYYSGVSGYYKDLATDGVIDADPTEDIAIGDYASQQTRKQQASKEERIWFTKDEVRQVVEHVPAPTIRNRLLVLFQYFTALRRQEVVDVKIEDLDRAEREVKVRGKNDTLHTAYWQPTLDGLLNTWLDDGYREASPYADESPYLFLSQHGPSLSADRLNTVVVEAAKNAGIQEVLYEDAKDRKRYKYTSHALRHSFAMHWLQNGGSMEALSKHLAHSSVTTTEIYGEILEKRASEEYESHAPDINLGL